jgi:tripartite ATP-independent transporter DctP family solute receptor
MMKRANFTLVLAVCLGLIFGVCGASFAAAKHTFTLGHTEPTNVSTHLAALKFSALVAERTNGEVEIVVHPNSELGAAVDQAQMVQSGAITMAMLPAGHVATIVPEVQVFTIPFFFPGDVHKMAEIVNGPAIGALNKNFSQKDIELLAVLPHAPKQFTSNKPIKTPGDFKGQKIRTMASPLIVESYKLLGATPVPINYHEVYTALQLGTVDGEENPFWAIGEMKFYEVQKHIVVSNHAYLATIFFVNKALLAGLSDEFKEIIVKTANEILPYQLESELEIDKENEDKIRAYKDTAVTELSADAIAEFKEIMKPVKDIYIEMVGDSGKEVLEAYEKEMAK